VIARCTCAQRANALSQQDVIARCTCTQRAHALANSPSPPRVPPAASGPAAGGHVPFANP
jgi:hypothetical protein